VAEVDGQARAKLLEALRAGGSVSAAAEASGYTRQHVYRLAGTDQEVGAALEAAKARPGRGRRRTVPGGAEPEGVTTADGTVTAPQSARPPSLPASLASPAPSPLVEAVAAGAPEAVERMRAILRIESESPGVLLAQCKAAQLVLEVAGRPAPVGALRARAEASDGRAVEVEGTGPGIEGLVARILGGGASG
jgi:hypothetical protein